jgi:hypothetical protein
LKARFPALEDHLSAVRLALPSRYLDVARNVIVNESTAQHHARLICILHLHAARLLISLPLQEPIDSAEWVVRWQRTIEYCEEVVVVVGQWKAQHCLSVDPAICFIISSVVILLHLHSRDRTNLNSELQSRLQTQKDLLKLFLEQFASIWHLPRFLICMFKPVPTTLSCELTDIFSVSCEKFFEKFPDPITTIDIDRILRKFPGFLHSGWFRTIAVSPHELQPPALQGLDKYLLLETDFSDWESWANVSDMNFIA